MEVRRGSRVLLTALVVVAAMTALAITLMRFSSTAQYGGTLNTTQVTTTTGTTAPPIHKVSE